MENKISTIKNQDNQIFPPPTIDLSNQVILHIPNRFVQIKSKSEKNQLNIPIDQIGSTYRNEKNTNLIENLDEIILELSPITKDKIIRLLNDCSKLLEFNSFKYFKDKIINEISDLINCLINIKIKDNLNDLKFEINYVKRDEIFLKLIDNRFTILNQEKMSNQLISKLINENQKLIDDLNDLDGHSSTDSDVTLVGVWSDDNLLKTNLSNNSRIDMYDKINEFKLSEIDKHSDEIKLSELDEQSNKFKLNQMNKSSNQMNKPSNDIDKPLNEIKVKLYENSSDLNNTNRISDHSFRIKDEMNDNLSSENSFNHHFMKPNYLRNYPKLKTIINQLNENDLSKNMKSNKLDDLSNNMKSNNLEDLSKNIKSDNLDNLSNRIFELKNEVDDLRERLSQLNKKNINNLSATTEIKIKNQFDKTSKSTNLKNCISLTELNIKSSIITKFKI